MKKVDLKVLYYLKRQQVKASGLCPVMGRITIGNSVAQFSLKLDADASLWDTKAGRMRGKSAAANAVNRQIEHVSVLIHTRYAELKARQQIVTAEDVKNAMQGTGGTDVLLLALFRKMNDEFVPRVGVDRSSDSYQIRLMVLEEAQAFLRKRRRVSDIAFRSLTYSFIEEFQKYLLVDRQFKANTVKHHIVYLRQVVHAAVKQGFIPKDPFDGFKMESQPTAHRRLTRDELGKVMALPIQEGTVKEYARDIFVFASFTGMAFADIKKLTMDEVVTMGDGSRWIVSHRQKTNTPFSIKLMEIPLSIIKKYHPSGNTGLVFPDLPKRNNIGNHLSSIADKCGLSRRLSVHTGRHTFASLSLSEGVPIETVSKVLGHTNITTTQIYAELALDKVAKDIRALSERIKGQYTWIDKYEPLNNRQS